MSKEYDVRLRGHHLRALYHFRSYRNNRFQLASYERRMSVEYKSREHAQNLVRTLEKICAGNVRVKLTDRLDDICRACPRRGETFCRRRIPFGGCAAHDDRATTYNFGFRIGRVYRSRYLLRKLQQRWFDF